MKNPVGVFACVFRPAHATSSSMGGGVSTVVGRLLGGVSGHVPIHKPCAFYDCEKSRVSRVCYVCMLYVIIVAHARIRCSTIVYVCSLSLSSLLCYCHREWSTCETSICNINATHPQSYPRENIWAHLHAEKRVKCSHKHKNTMMTRPRFERIFSVDVTPRDTVTNT